MKFLGAALAFAPFAAAIWPIPSSYTSGETVLWISNDVKVLYNGVEGNAVSGSGNTSRIIHTAIQRTYDTIFNKNFVPWKFHPRNSDFEPSTSGKKFVSKITLQQTATDPKNVLKPLAGDLDESYSLTLTESGEATIKAKSSIGIVRGLTTFTQLFYQHSKGGVYTNLAPVEITDSPKFAHRGLNMDTSRNFFKVSDIKKTIDALAYNKFNRLHIHVTDAQSWPLEIPAIPELAQEGKYGPGMTYSPADIEEIQTHGALQGVQVFLEIDMPGHTSSIFFSHPELIAAFNVQPDWDTYCAQPPCGTLKLNSTAVDDFVKTLFDDLLPRLSPYTAYYHTGGDEIKYAAYKLDNTVGTDDPEVLGPLIAKFVDNAHKQVRAAGLTPIVWEEILLAYNVTDYGTLGKDVVVQTWQSDEAVAEVVKRGYKALVGNYNYWYLDCGQGQWLNFKQGDSSQTFYPYADYCSPRKNWRLMYAYDPLEGVPEANQDLVIGGECHIWSEQTDPANLDRMVWPRAAAAGEVLWSGAKDAQGNNRSQELAAPRLSEMRERLVARGVMAETIQMPFCTQNGTQCSL